jgi:hypothetical protein
MGSFHDLYQPLLVAEQLRVDVNKLRLLLFGDFPEDGILPRVVDSGAVVGSAQIEDGFPDQQLFGEGVVDPFLGRGRGTSISWWRMVLLGEWMRESFSKRKVILSCSWFEHVK